MVFIPPVKGKRQIKHPSLATVPELVSELHPYLNGELATHSVSLRSNQKVWWRCIEGHNWLARISHRTEVKSGCPYCAHTLPTPSYNLAVLFPGIAAEWSVVLNGVEPINVLPKSSRPYWWSCSVGHVWRTTPLSRTGLGTGCPECSRSSHRGLLVQETRPDLFAEWLVELNYPVLASSITEGSHQLLWWRCHANDSHWWRAQMSNRSKGTGCPFCRGNRRTAANALTQSTPLAIRWHPTMNTGLSPTQVPLNSSADYWWRLDSQSLRGSITRLSNIVAARPT